MTPVLLALGANLGDRAGNLGAAVAGLRRFLDVRAVSPIYETAPMYDAEQPAFLNQVVLAETGLAPEPLLVAAKHLERRLGRTASHRFGPRAIDIDILFYDAQTVRSPDLEVPHPRIAERGFVLVPAADVAPGWRHPETGVTVAEMLHRLGRVAGVVRHEPALAVALG